MLLILLLRKNFNFLSFLLFFLFTLSSILVSLNRFWQYEVFYYDFGIFDRAIWLVSQFRPPIIDHLVVGGRIIFADHFNPSIFIFAPFYWLFERSEILLVIQSFTVGLSGLYIYKIGNLITKNSFFSFSVLTSFYLFVGLQNALIFDFHEVTVATLFLVLCFYFFLKNKTLLTLLFFLLTLGFKESNFLLGIGIAICFGLLNKKHLLFALSLIALSILWGVVTIKFLIPYFSGGQYGYSVIFSWDKLNLLSVLFDNPTKRATIFYSFLSFGFLPLLSVVFWFLILQDFLVRFLSSRITLGLHYSALLACILAISSLYSFSVLQKIKMLKKYLFIVSVLLVLNAIFLYRFVLRGPLALSYNISFYQHTKDFKFLNEFVAKIPLSSTVMTQNNLASHFTHAKNLWVLKDNYENYKPDYILLDLRDGQNAANFFPTQDPNLILNNLLRDKNYSAIFNNKNQYLFKRVKRSL